MDERMSRMRLFFFTRFGEHESATKTIAEEESTMGS